MAGKVCTIIAFFIQLFGIFPFFSYLCTLVKLLFLIVMQMKRYYMVLLWILASITMLAVPAKRNVTGAITLSDGTIVNARLVGDEYGHFWMADNGKSYQQIDGHDYFTEVDAEAVKQHAQTRRAAANARRAQRLQSRRIGEVGSYFGQKKGLVILVNFSNVSFQASNDSALYVRIANEQNFNEGNFVGSMYDYFNAQSEGQFQLTFDIVGPVTVSKTQSYYGSNDFQGNDKHPAEMAHEAVELVKDQVENWSQYDWDGDGYVDQVYFVYAGKGEADGGATNTIWPHAWSLSDSGEGMVTVGNGLKVNTYACGSELMANGQIEGIGTMCHEFSHCLGYPDFYDIDYSGGQGMDNWDLMSGGSYNGYGFRPAGYTSYERWMAGWKLPIELNKGKAKVENMKGLQDGGEFYVMYNDGHPDEYFLLENRTLSGWDQGLPGSGLLIIHVDYNAYIWSMNQPNDDPNHQRMTWIPSDGSYNFSGYGANRYPTQIGNDTYPNMNGNDTFFDTSTPATELYNKNMDGTKLLHKGVKNIVKNSDGTISFDFLGTSTVKTPEFSPKGGVYVEPQTVSITCATEGTTIYYTLDGTDPTTASTVYTEPLTIGTNVTIKAMAVSADDESWVGEAKYRFASVTPTDLSVDYVWKEDFTGAAANFPVEDVVNENACYSGDGGEYAVIYNEKLAGGTAPEVLVPNKSRNVNSLTANIAIGMVSGECKLSFKSNKSLTVTSETEGVSITSDSHSGKTYNYIVNVPDNTSTLQLTFANETSQNARLDDIVLMKPEKHSPDLSFPVSTTMVRPELFGPGYELPVLNNPYNLPVVYSSSETEIATIDESTGVITLTGVEGVTEIMAVFEGNDEYAAGKASYTLKVGRYKALLSFEETSLSAVAKDPVFKSPTLNNQFDVPVVYESSNPEVAAVDPNTGAVTIGKSGSAMISAVFDGNEMYAPDVASYEVIVEKAVPELWFKESDIQVMLSVKTFQIPEMHNPNQLPLVYWSGDETMATVDEQGVVTLGDKAGDVTITAFFGGDDYYDRCMTFLNVYVAQDTGISTLTGEQSAGEWYTIQGVCVDKPAKGLYIYKGRTIVVK